MKQLLILMAIFVATAAHAQTVPDVDPGFELGLQLGDYSYRENPNFMELHADGLAGVNAALTVEDLMNMGPVRLEGRLVYAPVDYSSNSGTSADSTNIYGELRALWLRSWSTGYGDFVPYFGLGLRRLYNDLNDTATAQGYTRVSTYLYAPLGLAYHSYWSEYGGLGLAGEFAPLLWGRQYSGINDGINNTQTSGMHMRFTAMWETEKFKLGPYYQFWKVDDSDIGCSGNVCGLEPKNFTREYGLSVQAKF